MTDFFLLAFMFLIAGVASVPIASRTGLGSVLGYLIAGIAISPLLVAMKVDVVAIQHFAEFGVVMMLFLVGLELNPKLLWQMRAKLFGLGGGQVGITALAVAAVALYFDLTWQVSVAIGVVFALSSTAIVLQTLGEKGLMKSDGGQSSFSILLFQDIAVIPILALLPLLAVTGVSDGLPDGGHGGGHEAISLVAHLSAWQTTLVTLGAVALVVFGGSYLTRFIFRFIAVTQLREMFTASALMIIFGIALLMSLVGLSPALGTFLAGVVLANNEYRHELESSIEPFKGLLLGLFFMTVGASVDFQLLGENWQTILSMTFGLILIKAGVLFVLAKAFRIRGENGWLMALGLAQAGEFGFVLLSFTVANGVIPKEIADLLLLVVALSMLLTPVLFIVYDKVIMPRYSQNQERPADKIHEQNHIIIVGHGRVGGLVGRMLKAAGYPATFIDFSSKQLDFLKKFGIHTYFGDATQPDLLHAAGIQNAKLLVVTIDGMDQITELVKYVVKTYPHVHVIARAITRDHVYVLYSVGCRDIIRETYDSSVRMGRSAFEAMGIDRAVADRMAESFEEADRKAMIEVAPLFDVNLPTEENKEYIAKIREIIPTLEATLEKEMTAIRKGQA